MSRFPKPSEGGRFLTWATVAWEQIRRNRVKAGPGLMARQTTDGLVLSVARKKTSQSTDLTGAFCRVFKAEGAWLLTGGQVSGGVGNETIADITLGSVETPPADNTHHWLAVSYTATVEDDVLLPGGDVTAVSVSSGTTIPDNTTPTAIDPDGTIHVSLGSWSSGKFIPAACGNIQISHCPGALTYFRGVIYI